jgi:uncharacterized protein with HEPN domain
MSRDPSLYLDDIGESCRRIVSYTSGMSLAEFASDPKTLDAVARNLEVIGEAVKRLPTEWKERRQDVGLRDLLIHAYFGIDVEILWDIVENKVPVLADTVATMRQAEAPKR